jgi:hypothetical protein
LIEDTYAELALANCGLRGKDPASSRRRYISVKARRITSPKAYAADAPSSRPMVANIGNAEMAMAAMPSKLILRPSLVSLIPKNSR